MQNTSFCGRLFDCLRNGFVLSKTVLFIWGLVLSQSLVQKAVVDFLIYFLQDELLSLRKAIVLTNMLYLISAVFKVGVTHISEAYTSHFSVIIFCTAAYIMGLMLLWFQTWYLTWFQTGLILAIVLIALGKAVECPSLRDFFDHQLSEKVKKKCTENNKREDNKESSNLWSTTAYFIGASIATFWTSKSDEIDWSEIFSVSALVMGSMYFLFFSGIFCYYPEARSIGSPLTTIYRVFKAAIQKRRLPYPSSKEGYYSDDNTHQGSNTEKRPTGSPLITAISRVFKASIDKDRILPYPCSKESYDSEKRPTINTVSSIKKRRFPNSFSSVEGHSSNSDNEGSNNDLKDPFYRRENGEVHLLPRDASFLLFLDKAAIARKDKFDVQGRERYEEVCTAEQVRDVKSLYPLIPLGFIFFAYGLTLASGNTYFVLQTQNLNPKVGNFRVPVVAFFVLKSSVAFVVTTIQTFRKLVKPTWSIAVGMFCSVLCCIAASLVEHYRLHLMEPFKDVQDMDNIVIPLSIMVLTPQYLPLGLMQGFAEYGLEALLCFRVPESMIKFVEPCIEMLLAIGNFSSILFVLIFHSWIKDPSINNSHLEKYFLMLTSLNILFFGIYVCSAKFKLLKFHQFDEPSETNQGTIGSMSAQLEDLGNNINS